MAKANAKLSPAKALAEMSEESVLCRDLSHAWRPYTAQRIPGGFQRTVRCATCGTDRIEELDRYGMLVRRRYDYADGYLVEGMGRADADFRARVRLSSILRAMRGDT